MKPLQQYFSMVSFVFQYFTKWNLGFFLNFDVWHSWEWRVKPDYRPWGLSLANLFSCHVLRQTDIYERVARFMIWFNMYKCFSIVHIYSKTAKEEKLPKENTKNTLNNLHLYLWRYFLLYYITNELNHHCRYDVANGRTRTEKEKYFPKKPASKVTYGGLPL